MAGHSEVWLVDIGPCERTHLIASHAGRYYGGERGRLKRGDGSVMSITRMESIGACFSLLRGFELLISSFRWTRHCSLLLLPVGPFSGLLRHHNSLKVQYSTC